MIIIQLQQINRLKINNLPLNIITASKSFAKYQIIRPKDQ